MTFKQKAALKLAQAKSAAKRKLRGAKASVKSKVGATARLRLKKKVTSKVKTSKVVRRGKGIVASAKSGAAAGKRVFSGKASASEKRNRRIGNANAKAGGKANKIANNAALIGGAIGGLAGGAVSRKVSKIKKSRTATAKLRKSITKKRVTKKKEVKHLNKSMKRAGVSPKSRASADRFIAKKKSYDPRKGRR